MKNRTAISMAWGIVLILSAGRAFGAEAPVPAKVAITRVWPAKIVYKPGETAKITVDLENKTKDALTASVSLAINYGLVARDELPAQSASLPAGGKATVTFAYPVPKGRKWGHAVMALVKAAGGETLAQGREFFAVGNNPWEVGHYITMFGLRGWKQNGRIDNGLLPSFRAGYITTIEGYSWQPSVFDEMTPDTETWRSGQGGYKEGKQDWIYLISQAHAQGMAVVTYIQGASYGPAGVDFARRHPAWMTLDKNGRPSAFFDVDKLTAWREDPESQPFDTPVGGFLGNFLPGNQVVGDYWIDELIRSVEMFGWDGFRSDGAPGVIEGYDYQGKLHEVKDPGEANAAYLRKVRARLTQRFPNFIYGWNNVVGGYPKTLCSAAEEDVMLPGAYSLYENFNSASQPSCPFHPWKKAAYYLQNEAAPIREHGGFPHAGWMWSLRYVEAVASASGMQVDQIQPWPVQPLLRNYARFEFRWSEFLWDNQLRYVRPGGQAVKVEGPAQVWWQDFVHARDLPDGRQRVIVHLLNMPANDDEAWADRPPAPATNVRVRFTVPPNKKLARLVAFSPDGTEDVIPATPDAKGALALPEVKLWTVVVAEFK